MVKVQRPLSTNEPIALWLLYGKGHTHIRQLPEAEVPKHVRKIMDEQNLYKAYFDAVFSQGKWSIDDLAKNQNQSW